MLFDNVLVTGGTGTFGQAFVRRCLAEGVERICVFSRDELKQAEMRAELNNSRVRWFVGDVRDRERLRRAFEGVQLVVHAAALKRVEVGEYDASEMVKTNVLGAINVIEAAHDARVEQVIALSTDKAEDPVSAYGASKLLMEKLVLAANNSRGDYGPVFGVVRCGNFFGSRGSILPVWRLLIRAGEKSVPLTDERCTRFLMTADQAVELVMQMSDNETPLVVPRLPMFRPVDLAEALGVGYYQTGLGKEEKLHEILGGVSSEHAPLLDVEMLRELCSQHA